MARQDPAVTVVGLKVESDRTLATGGFLCIRRVELRNRYGDGGLSERYVCDFAMRPSGRDAVVVALYHRTSSGGVEVLLRAGLRPALALGRGESTRDASSLFLTELVAGVVEPQDLGEQGIVDRAVHETHEEAGFRVSAESIVVLGAGTFPTGGSMPEKFWLTAVHIDDPSAQEVAPGDGSPMEEGATTRWMPIDAAIDACVAGDIEDMKTELTLRRLRDRLAEHAE